MEGPHNGEARGLRVSKLIKTRSDLLNFVLETQYVTEVFEREFLRPPEPPEKKDDRELRARAMNEDEG